jgi:glucosamine--fructose-6-phosphate aminotransferase (isomerizing)
MNFSEEIKFMCGIVGIIGQKPVAARLIDALKRLEYRGYDSAGIATLRHDGSIGRRRAEGKLRNLEKLLDEKPLEGVIGIGHTRWATHGAPTTRNAHPHLSGEVAVVHNGILENYKDLREELEALGCSFQTDTDTEVAAHLVARELERSKSPQEAVRHVLPRLKGAFALVFLFAGYDDMLIVARKGSPLALGHGEGEMYIGSDALALAPFTDEITYLDEGDWAVVHRQNVTIYDDKNMIVDRAVQKANVAAMMADKGNYRHFMAKEIFEQPEMVSHTLGHYIDMVKAQIALREDVPFDWARLDSLAISACGTAYYAGMVAKYWFERFARLPVEIDVASEFRYREAPLRKGSLALFISQSGETADTLATLRYCKSQGLYTAGIVNVKESTIAREADVVFPTLAGPEIGVASTKAFTCQLTVLCCLAVAAGRARGHLSEEDEHNLVQALIEMPRFMADALTHEADIEALARDLSKAKDVLYLGRGTNYPMAMEGALKLKEISYIHAEGYAAGELKHGPIALIDESMPVVVIAPFDRVFEKTASNMQEVAARGGRIILITDAKGAEVADIEAIATFVMPDIPATIVPMIYAIPIQLLAYHTAVLLGTDVDQPRNLAKSVTVE